MKRPRRRLRNRLMLAFGGFAVLVAGLFGLYAMSFMYATEDAFFEAALQEEAVALERARRAHGRWETPRSPYMKVYTALAQFPDDLRERYQREFWREEFAGRDGRHYHIKTLSASNPADGAWLVAEVSRQLVVRPIRDRVLQLLAWSAAAVLALALAIAYWLARRTAAPLARLATQVGSITPQHLPVLAVPERSDDEIGLVAQGVSDLVERIRTFIGREREFTRDASHELRTPLAVIGSTSERLLEEPGLSPAGRQHLIHLRQSALQLERTVAMLLSLARETQDAPPMTGPVAVLPLLERVILDQAVLLEGKSIELDIDVPSDVHSELPEPVLHIVLSNLIGNAFAHTEAGRVRIGVDHGEHGRGTRLCIANSGYDIAPELLASVHRPYRRREGSAGLGLGLAIVRRLCERYRIDLDIQTLDGLTRVEFGLAPLAEAAK
ncbi:sensor histidine kinase [Lysobacter sp. CA199]|uniref:sensor histidine kinase n=1 Tax=Lysobacter sp. CA199 TaxID=3455608 RepID=UPI003F8D4909